MRQKSDETRFDDSTSGDLSLHPSSLSTRLSTRVFNGKLLSNLPSVGSNTSLKSEGSDGPTFYFITLRTGEASKGRVGVDFSLELVETTVTLRPSPSYVT